MQKESWFKLDDIMKDLQAVRKIFHSEDDLKFSLANVIKDRYKNSEVRLERPSKIDMTLKRDDKEKPKEKTISIDITVFKDKECRDKDIIFLELKYKTRILECDIDGDKYHLTNQGAVDIGRFLFRKDIYRLEQAIKKLPNSNCKGYFIVITNDAGYEKDISDNEVLNKNYSFHNQLELAKLDPGWNYKKDGAYVSDVKHPDKDDKHWSCRGSMAYKLNLINEYIINWQKYSEISQQDVDDGKDLIFRHCIIEVNE